MSSQALIIGHGVDYLIESIASVENPKYLLSLLDERNAVYNGCGTNQVIKIKAEALARLASTGLPKKGLPFVLEALESGNHPYLVAGAARAIKGWKKDPSLFIPYLLAAIEKMKGRDDFVAIGTKYMAPGHSRTSIEEIAATLAWMGGFAKDYLAAVESVLEDPFHEFSEKAKAAFNQALCRIKEEERKGDCCSTLPTLQRRKTGSGKIDHIQLEDESGGLCSYTQAFSGKTTIVCFFYTRCHNPHKCASTIYKMARLQKLIKEKGWTEHIQTAAITYDPLFDLPDRLSNYVHSRGYRTDGSNHVYRCISGFETLKAQFALAVNYNSSIVNSHAVELYILDKHGKLQFATERLLWKEEEVIEKALSLGRPIDKTHVLFAGLLPFVKSAASTVPSLFMAFFPKCPFCFASYLSLFGLGGLYKLYYSPWFVPAILVLAALHLGMITVMSKRRNFYLPVFMCLAGYAGIILFSVFYPIKAFGAMGGALIFAGSLWSSLYPVYVNRIGHVKKYQR